MRTKNHITTLFVAVVFSFVGIVGPALSVQATDYVTVHYRDSHEVRSASGYRGDITVTVSGTGRAAGNSYSDAFYIYTDENGRTITPRRANEFGLYINGRPATDYATPSYRSDHRYEFTVSGASNDRRSLGFSIGDTYVNDNSGSLQVTVAERSSYYDDDYYYNRYDRADLQVKNIAFEYDAPLRAGALVRTNVRIANVGNRDVSYATIRGYVNGKEQFSSRESLRAGEDTWTGYSFSWRAESGSNSVRFVIDADGNVTETNESNNSYTKTVATVSYSPYQDNKYGQVQGVVSNRHQLWYVNPVSQYRSDIGANTMTREELRRVGVGITNTNLLSIPMGIVPPAYMGEGDYDSDGLTDSLERVLGTDYRISDTDRDGYSDSEELRFGYNPRGEGRYAVNTALTNRLTGRIMLQVQSRGEAWYINPIDNKRYYIDGSNPEASFRALQSFMNATAGVY